MANKEETKFWNRIRPDLNQIGWFLKTQMLAQLGIPDVIGVINGQFIALELKADEQGHGGKTEKLQEIILERIANHGGFCRKVWPENWPKVYQELLLISRRGKNV